jgi:hypothetical protein
VTGVDAGGTVVCSSLGDAITSYINTSCSVYFGWQDSCDGCTTDPTKWGSSNGDSCQLGPGADDTCTAPTVGSSAVPLFGLNPDGNVNGDDKLHFGLHCAAPPAPPSGGCAAGQFATGFGSDGTPVCADPSSSARKVINTECFLYSGWRDNCDGCALDPTKFDRVNDGACESLAGAGDVCTVQSLDGSSIRMSGIDFDGDVDGNDKIYTGFRCEPGQGPPAGAVTSCPSGEAVIGLAADGSLACAPIAPAAHSYFTGNCWLYVGWLDSCGGCTDPPAKWGRVREGACENGVGADDTCTAPVLGTQTITLFGLNPNGDVDGNDLMYFGMKCF